MTKKNSLIILLLILIAAGFKVTQSGATASVIGNKSVDSSTAASPAPAGGEEPLQGLQCHFKPLPSPGPPSNTRSPKFSAPQVAYESRGALNLAQWLPDNQRILLTRDTPGKNRQIIETFDTWTGEVTTYADRNFSGSRPVWFAPQNTVAYLDWQPVRPGSGEVVYTLFAGDTILDRSITSLSLGVDSQDELLYFTEAGGLSPQSRRDNAELSTPDLANWQTSPYPASIQFLPSPFQIAPRPGSSQVVYFNQPDTIMADEESACRLNIGYASINGVEVPAWALDARWSPNGRFLALITTNSFPGQAAGTGAIVMTAGLTLLDFELNTIQTLAVAPEIAPGRQIITDLAWDPGRQWLAVLGLVGIDARGFERAGLFLVEAATGTVTAVETGMNLGGGSWGKQLIWSGDGILAAGCPTPSQGRICLLETGN